MVKNTKSFTYPLRNKYSPLKSYRYRIDISYIYDGLPDFVNISTAMTDFTVEKKFSTLVLPILVVDFMLKRETLVDMQNNIDSLKFNLNIDRFPVEINDNTLEDKEIDTSFPERHIKDLLLIPYDLDLSPPNLNRETIAEEDNDEIEESVSSNNYPLKVYLFSEKLLEVTRGIDSVVLMGVDPIDTIFYLMETHNVPTDSLILSYPDRMSVDSQVIIPPLKLKPALDYYQKYYGMYKYGFEFFLDFKDSYLISSNIVESNVRNTGEYSTITIELSDQFNAPDGTQIPRYYQDDTDERYYVRLLDNSVSHIKQDSDRELIGEEITFISRDGIGKGMDSWGVTKVEPNLNDSVNKRENKVKPKRVYYNTTSNSFNVSETIFKLERSTFTLSVPISEVNLEYMTPNRIFHITYTNQKKNSEIGGFYQLLSMDLKADTNTANLSTFGGYLTLAKIKDL